MFQYFSYDDFRKTRRSVLVFAIATLLFAGVTIIDSKLSLLGLQILISHQKIIVTGQIATLVLLGIYLLQVVPESIKLFKDFLLSRQKKRELIESAKLQDSWGLHDGKEYDDGPSGEFDQLNDKHEWLRQETNRRLDPLINVAQYIAIGLVDFVLPAIIGIICVYDPYLLDRHLSNYGQMQTLFQSPLDSTFSSERVAGCAIPRICAISNSGIYYPSPFTLP